MKMKAAAAGGAQGHLVWSWVGGAWVGVCGECAHKRARNMLFLCKNGRRTCNPVHTSSRWLSKKPCLYQKDSERTRKMMKVKFEA